MGKGWVRVVVLVLGGVVGGYAGYWIGHLAGWSSNADWPWNIGGGTGAILSRLEWRWPGWPSPPWCGSCFSRRSG